MVDGDSGEAMRPAPSKLSAGDRLSSIQALRAIAVFLVILLHIQDNELRASADPVLSEWLTHGRGGVDLFFVISGFVMVWITTGDRGTRTVGAFLFSRAARIYPAVWLFTSLAIIGFVVAGTFNQWAASENRILFSYLLLPHELGPVLGVSWTVVHELYFYSVFALFLFLPARVLPAGLFIWAAIVAAGSLAPAPDQKNAWGVLALSPMTLEFIAGAFVAIALINWKPHWPGAVAVVGLLFAIMGPLWWGIGPMDFAGWDRVLVYGAPSVALVYAAAGMELAGQLRAPRWMTAIGDISYSLYLSHLLVIATLAHLWMRFALPGPIDNIAMISIMVAVPLVLAAIVYVAFERPSVRLAHDIRRSLFGDNHAAKAPQDVKV